MAWGSDTAANGMISRETITVLSGQSLQAGAALGKVTASRVTTHTEIDFGRAC